MARLIFPGGEKEGLSPRRFHSDGGARMDVWGPSFQQRCFIGCSGESLTGNHFPLQARVPAFDGDHRHVCENAPCVHCLAFFRSLVGDSFRHSLIPVDEQTNHAEGGQSDGEGDNCSVGRCLAM